MMRHDLRGRPSREFLLALGGCDRPDWVAKRGILLQRQRDARLCVLRVGPRHSRLDGLAEALSALQNVRSIERRHWALATAELAETCDYPFVLVGHAGRTSVRDKLLGTEVERLLRISSRPVLVVNAKPVESYRTALVATNLPPSNFNAALVTSRLFPRVGMQLVNSIHAPFEGFIDRETLLPELRTERMAAMRSYATNLAKAARRRVSAEVIEGDFPYAIASVAKAEGIDLLVLGTRSTGVLKGWRRQRALDLVAASPVDVLVVPDLLPQARHVS